MGQSNYAHEFIHSNSISHPAACMAVLQETGTLLEHCHTEGLIQGHHAFIVAEEADRWANFLEADVDALTSGKYPYVYVFVQPKESGGANVDDLMRPLGYIRVV